MARALVVARDAAVASSVGLGLRAAGFTSMTAVAGKTVATMAAASVDLVVLDLDVPGAETTLRQLRPGGVPVLLLAGRHRDTQAIDDALAVLTKPVQASEVLDQVRAAAAHREGPDPSELTRGAVSVNTRTRQITVDGHPVELSMREFALAEELLRHAGQVLSRTRLLKSVWGVELNPRSNIVDVYIAYLRKKVGRRHIETVRGVGYRWR